MAAEETSKNGGLWSLRVELLCITIADMLTASSHCFPKLLNPIALYDEPDTTSCFFLQPKGWAHITFIPDDGSA